MNISSYGKNCVRIEVKDASVLVDPFDTAGTGLRSPTINDDLVLLSAYEQPKAVLEKIPDEALLVRGPGEYEKKGIAVRAVLANQDSQKGAELGICSIFSIVAEEMSICHLGSLGQETLTDEQMEAIGDPDILIIPFETQGALDPKAAAALATAIEPKIIVALGKADAFAKQMGLPVEKMSELKIQKKQLPTDQTLLVVLGQ